MKLKHCILHFLLLLTFVESILLFSEAASSQSIRWDSGREPIIIPQETKDDILGLFQKGFWHRDQIKSGQMKIAYRLKMRDQDNEKTQEITLAFDEKRHRVDQREVFQRNPAAGNNVPFVSVGCIGCYEGNDQILILYSQYVKENDPFYQSILTVYDTSLQFKGQEATSIWTESLSFIPQYIVYCSTDRFPTKKTLDQAWDRLYANSLGMLDGIAATDVTITDERYKETDCKKVVFETKWDEGIITRNSMWFAEEQGYALRKHYLQYPMYDELLEVDVALDKDSGIWFPSAWHYERNNHYEGNNTRSSEDGTITDVVLNKPIPEKIFTMEDIKTIPAGVMVSWATERFPPPHGANRFGDLLWDGHEIITRGMRAERLVEQARTESKSKKRQFIILANVAVISMILAVFLWRYYTRIKQKN